MTSTEQTLDEAFADVTALFTGDSLVPEPEPVRTHTINVELANKVLDYIEANPEEHEQGSWATMLLDCSEVDQIEESITIDQAKELALGTCNTAGCFAGWAAALSGHTVGTVGELAGVLLDLTPGIKINRVEDRWTDGSGNEHVDYWTEVEYESDEDGCPVAPVEAEGWAREALGLTRGQANALFYGRNSRDQIRQMLFDWTDGEIARYSTAA